MGNLFKPGNVAVVQLDIAGITLGDKSKVFFKLFDFGYKFGLKVLFGVNLTSLNFIFQYYFSYMILEKEG